MKQYTGKTVDEVLDNISSEQNCAKEDIVYNVIEEKKHLLGIGNTVTIEAFTPNDVNNAIIIGKNGQTLRAISIVLKAAANATFKKRINIIIDVNHYKEDRYKKVKGIANRVAREVVKTHIDAELDPMPNDERKVIHQYLQDFKGVSTVSIGEGPKRHLVIKYAGNEE